MNSTLNEKILNKIYDVLVRIEKHLLKYEPKKEKPKKDKRELLNDKFHFSILIFKLWRYLYGHR